LRIVRRNAPPGKNAGQEIAGSMNLRDRKSACLPRGVEPATPRAPKHGTLDPEKRAGGGKRFVHTGW
jgi:hypothetical protein